MPLSISTWRGSGLLFAFLQPLHSVTNILLELVPPSGHTLGILQRFNITELSSVDTKMSAQVTDALANLKG